MANQVAHGFINLQHLFDQRVTTVGIGTVMDAVAASLAEHNRQVDALIGLFCRRTTEFQTRYRSGAAAGRLQPLDQNGRARPIRPAGQYDIAFPLQMAGAAWGANFVTRAKMTVQEANEATTQLMIQDARWIRDHILAALYTNASYTWADDEKGNLTVYGLANSDTTTYNILGGADAGAADTHYLAQAAAIADATDPYDDLYDDLIEHPENGGEVIALIPSNLRATTTALAAFNELSDARLRVGANTAQVIGTPGVALPGSLLGYHNAKVWIVEWRALPSDYIIAVTTQGEKALAMREDPEAELRGFRVMGDRVDEPWWERQYFRRAGFGGYNRVGAAVYRVGNGTYAIPTGYTVPMA